MSGRGRSPLPVSVMVHLEESTEIAAQVRWSAEHDWYGAVNIEGASSYATLFLRRAEMVRLGEVLGAALAELDAKESAGVDGAAVATTAA